MNLQFLIVKFKWLLRFFKDYKTNFELVPFWIQNCFASGCRSYFCWCASICLEKMLYKTPSPSRGLLESPSWSLRSFYGLTGPQTLGWRRYDALVVSALPPSHLILVIGTFRFLFFLKSLQRFKRPSKEVKSCLWNNEMFLFPIYNLSKNIISFILHLFNKKNQLFSYRT